MHVFGAMQTGCYGVLIRTTGPGAPSGKLG
jgi:hypothetical protein